MKVSVSRFLYLLLVLVIVLPRTGNAQQIPPNELNLQLEYAKGLYISQQYYDCITELKRLSFFDKECKYGFDTNYLIGKCYKAGAKISDAVKYFSLAQKFSPDDSILFNLKIEVVRCNILRRTNEQAFHLLGQLESDSRFKGRIKDIHYWKAWNYIFWDKWDSASVEFGRVSDNHPLKILAMEIEKEKYSVSFAKVISYILPGFGQFYTGNYISGIMSLGWTGLFCYLALDAYAADRIFDGFVMTGLFFRFHRGNAQNAEKFAVIKNKEISNQALNYLQNKFEGLKP